MAQFRASSHDRGLEGKADNSRLLDVLLNQLHARNSAVGGTRSKVSRRNGRNRCALRQIHAGEVVGQRAPSCAALRHQPPGGQRLRLRGVAQVGCAGLADLHVYRSGRHRPRQARRRVRQRRFGQGNCGIDRRFRRKGADRPHPNSFHAGTRQDVGWAALLPGQGYGRQRVRHTRGRRLQSQPPSSGRA